MNNTRTKLQHAPIQWTNLGQPYSDIFKDKYFSEENGLLESQYVFCNGNDLSARFRKTLDQFTILETGFGTGLNFLCAWDLWRQYAPKEATLHFVSIEQFPLSKDDLRKVLSLWKGFKELSLKLIDAYPNKCMTFDGGRVTLSLYFMHVLEALEQIRTDHVRADAWFLDGFAPDKNPQMWSADVLSKVGQLSQKGTTFATFTARGEVRRSLMNNGFKVEKIKGFGRKRHMLKGIKTND